MPTTGSLGYGPGSYLVHVGPAGSQGLKTPPVTWRTFGPFTLRAAHNYLAVIRRGDPYTLSFEEDHHSISAYSKLECESSIYVRNQIPGAAWYALGLEKVEEEPPPVCEWDTFTPDPRAFAGQPGRVWPIRQRFATGHYLVYVGPAGRSGSCTPPATWKTFGPYSVKAGNKYLAMIQKDTPYTLLWAENPVMLQLYSKPAGDAVVYSRNDISREDQWYGICLVPFEPASGAGGSNDTRDTGATPSSGQEHETRKYEGIWIRKDNGNIVDVIKTHRSGLDLVATFHTSVDAPIYSEAHGPMKDTGDEPVVLETRDGEGKSLRIVIRVDGDVLTYNSYNQDGSHRFSGRYTKDTGATPSSGQEHETRKYEGIWIRKDNGNIVDVIKIHRSGLDLVATFHTSVDAPIYSEAHGPMKDTGDEPVVLETRDGEGRSIRIAIRVDGDVLTYNSYNEDGSHRFSGRYTKYGR